ncbi:methyl-accepting chemotaxis protein [Reichenbachiella ulvae]|uniref:Methyl-accepting chemotaxis protein n=1 Tax=Reichenbachiella ulvae TaxID=2980104 RepID=A0ABT3CX14_9BACT|nr:methyl-accepting chemotaxis protein [Reichenbachiella ulvae]MCV9388172.1 methyl-accepting chemotaxis protein [Reichenbachiella ulvae]
MTIKSKLNTVISSMSDFSKQTNMVAINASIHAGRLSPREGAPFQVLAREIQEMSSRSMDKLAELDQLMKEVGEMSRLINYTGRQRMLLMKLVNGKLMNDEEQMKAAISAFEEGLDFIKSSGINDDECSHILDLIDKRRASMINDLKIGLQSALHEQANEVIELINSLLGRYEEFAGQ